MYYCMAKIPQPIKAAGDITVAVVNLVCHAGAPYVLLYFYYIIYVYLKKVKLFCFKSEKFFWEINFIKYIWTL